MDFSFKSERQTYKIEKDMKISIQSKNKTNVKKFPWTISI